MTNITIHGDSLLVTATGEEATRVGTLLRRELGPRVSRPEGGCYRVDLTAAGRLFDLLGEGAGWNDSARSLAEQQLRHRDLQSAARFEVSMALQDPASALAGYRHLAKLDAHQREAVAAITTPSLRGLALFDEQGTGKTIVALCAFDRLRELGTVERLLVIAPKSVLGSWREEARAVLEEQCQVVLIDGSRAQRRRTWRSQHDILLCSYDTAVGDRDSLELLVSSRPGRYMLAVDESYYVKNPNTHRAQVVTEIRPNCERAIVLCGAPAPNSPRDLVNQIDVADGGVAFGGRVVPEDDVATHAVVAEALQSAIFLRRLKEDVLPGLPSKNIELVRINLQPEQSRLYHEAANALILDVRSVDDRQFRRQLGSFLARRTALLQICSHPGAIAPLYHEDPAKLLALDRLLRELVEQSGEKVVVWSHFRFSLDQIERRFARYGLVRIDGSVGRIDDRVEAIKRFQEDPSIRVFLGNAAAAGAGITLTASRHAIYESFSNQAAHWLQSVDRIHRRGQEREVISHVLLAEHTLEEREFYRLQHKERSARDLLGDHYVEPVTRERFLLDLQGNDHQNA